MQIIIFLIIFVIIQLIIFVFYKRKVNKISKNEKLFRTLVNMSLQPMLIENEIGEILFTSDSIKDLLRLNKRIPIKKNIMEYIHPDDVHPYNKFLIEILKYPNQKKSIEIRLKKEGQNWIWVQNDSINLLKYKHVKAIVSSFYDINFRKNIDFQKSELLKNEKNARTVAEKAVKDRDEFLSIASHELKTPLTTVLLKLQATLRKLATQSLADFSGRELMDSLQIAEKQSQNLSILIKDLLNISLATSDRLTINKEKINLAVMVNSLNEKFSEQIRLSKCKVKIINEDANVVGNWDPVRVEQALSNLLNNALKYAAGKNVTMLVTKDSHWGIFIIKDEGSGIPIEMQKHIFEPFKRANGDSSIKGLGVGLFITQKIAQSHGGDVQVKSEPGKGATFTLRLPLN